MIATANKSKLSGLVQGRVKFEMNGFCKGRSFERLPGYIDIEVLSTDSCQTLIDK
jgi:hypothetical protein